MILRPTASPAEAIPSDTLAVQLQAVLAAPQAKLLPVQVRSLILNLAITVDAHGARLRALEEVKK